MPKADFEPAKYKEKDEISRGLEEARRRMDAVKSSVKDAEVRDKDARRNSGYDSLAAKFKALQGGKDAASFRARMQEFSYEAGRVEAKLKNISEGRSTDALEEFGEKSFVPSDVQGSELRAFFDYLRSSVKSERMRKTLEQQWFGEKSFDGFASKFRGQEVFSVMEKKTDVEALREVVSSYAALDIEPYFKKILEELVAAIGKWLETRVPSIDERLERDGRELSEFRAYAGRVDDIGREAIDKERRIVEKMQSGRETLAEELSRLDRILKSWTPRLAEMTSLRETIVGKDASADIQAERDEIARQLDETVKQGAELVETAKALGERVRRDVASGALSEADAKARVDEMVGVLKENLKRKTELSIRLRSAERRLG